MIIFENKKNCCGCGACMNICPKNAISMKEDKCGFIFPSVNNDLCINCGQCLKVCAFQHIQEKNVPLKTWAAVSKDRQRLLKSSSGGVFYTLARNIIAEGGVAVGAVMLPDFSIRHVAVDSLEKLGMLQGSKYAQSSTGMIFREVKKILKSGRKVLFSGTPCQVAGLKSFLKKDYENLITADLICHGVPSNRMFKDYISEYCKSNKCTVKKFTFRDKTIGWGKSGSLKTQQNKKIKLYESNESYFYFFQNGIIMRSSCYSCKYAGKNRTGDITIGDYWGIEKQHPEYLGRGGLDERTGISVVIANTEKGIRLIDEYSSDFRIFSSDFEKASAGNANLNHPTVYNSERNRILELYSSQGWSAVEREFDSTIGLKRYSSFIKSLVPTKIKRILKG